MKKIRHLGLTLALIAGCSEHLALPERLKAWKEQTGGMSQATMYRWVNKMNPTDN